MRIRYFPIDDLSFEWVYSWGMVVALTGRFWFRKSWTGRLVLLVEEVRPGWFGQGPGKARWRNAKLLDFAEPELRTLMTVEQTHRNRFVPGTAPALRAIPLAAKLAEA